MEAIDERNRLLHSMKQKDLSNIERSDITINLKELKNWIDDQTRIAEERWAQALAEGIHCLKFNPKEAWDDINKLAAGESAMKSLKTMSLCKTDGNLAHTDKENMEVLKPHLLKIQQPQKSQL
jgi:hypothetical protein